MDWSLFHWHPIHSLFLAMTVRIKTLDGHEAEVMDLRDLAELQKRVIMWLIGGVVTLAIVVATGTGVWLNEHNNHIKVSDRVANIDTAGTQYGKNYEKLLTKILNERAIRDTAIALQLGEIIKITSTTARRTDRIERTLRLTPID